MTENQTQSIKTIVPKKTSVFPKWIAVFSMIFLIGKFASAQEVNVDNAVISVPSGTFMSTEGGVTLQNSGGINNNGTIQINTNWTNNASGLIGSGTGTVELNGANETIGGSVPTSFNNLTLQGTGVKTLGINTLVTSVLSLTDRELATGNFSMFVTNPAVGAITRTTGFVSSMGIGALYRDMNAVSTYVFPVGEVGRFRPVEITPASSSPIQFSVSLENNDPNANGYNRATNDGTQLSINSLYYHQINLSSGSATADVAIYFSPADGAFTNMVHWQGAPRWETMSPVTSVSGYGLSGWRKTAWTNFSPFAFSISDVTPPVVVCPSGQSVTLDANCQATLPNYVPLASATDNITSSPSIVITQSPPPGTIVSTAGTTSITLTATDLAGNTGTCSFLLTKSDTTRPVITCPSNITAYVNGNCNALVSYPAVTVTDNCPGATVARIAGWASPSVYVLGVHTNSFRATDLAGNTSTCSFTVTALDSTPPTLVCPSSVTVNTAPGLCNNRVCYPVLTGTDHCQPSINIPGFTPVASYTTNDYYVSTANTYTYAAARALAAASGGHIVVINNSGENAMLNMVTGGNLWIGLSDEITENVFVTESCEPSNYFNWNMGEPNGLTGENYVEMIAGGSGFWNDLPSASTRRFVMELEGGVQIIQTAGLPQNSQFPVGTTTNSFIANDGSGNTSTCSFTVTVNDVTPPTAVCQNRTVFLNSLGAVSTSAAAINNGSTDNCGTPTATLSNSNFTCLNLGPNTVTLTVTDASNNTASCSATVTVRDTIRPSITCINATVYLDNLGAVIIPAPPANLPTDNCGIASFTASPTSFSCANVGNNTVIVTVGDQNGNTNSCSGVLTVRDTVSPVANCGNVTVFLDAGGNASTTVAAVNNGSSDACGIQTPTLSNSAFTCANTGANTVTLTVLDVNNNSSTCSAIVTVRDTIRPVITCAANLVRNTDSNVCTWLANSAVNAPMTDNCPGSVKTYTSTGATTLSGNANANGATFNQGVTTLNYLATDASGNTTTCSLTVTVNDNQPPVVTCPANLSRNTNPGICTWLSGSAVNTVSVTDNCPGPVKTFSTTGVTTLSGSGNANNQIFNKGNTTIRYLITDVSGNTGTCSFILTINDNQAPTLTCPASITASTSPGLCTTIINNIASTANDNCPGVGTTYTSTGVTILTGSGNASGSTFNNGLTTVNYLATDASGLTATCSFNVTINDNELPTVTCPSNLSRNADPGLCVWSAGGAVNGSVADNCPSVQKSFSTTGATTLSGSGNANNQLYNLGVTTITYRATDASGNTATCSFTLRINDNQAPTLTCPSSVTVSTAPGLCIAVVNNIATASNDNCPGVSVSYSSTGVTTLSGLGNVSGSTFNKGLTTVTYLATDASGLTATCSFNVTVNDNELPVINCPASINRNTNPGLCSWLANNSVNAPMSDNCSGSIKTHAATGATTFSGNGNANGAIFNQGVTTLTYTATDASGNTATCSFTVTVNDNEIPTITCPANVIASTSPGICTTVINNIASTVNDNCPGTVVTYTSTGVTVLTGNGNASGSTFNKGVTTLSYLATDAAGNTAGCSFNLTVNDNELPIVSCRNDISRSTDPGVCTWLAGGAVNITSINDNCPGVVQTYSTSGVTVLSGSGNANRLTYNHGTTTITYLATDASGNTASCSFNLTVNDNEVPTITCPNNLTRSTNPGVCTWMAGGAVNTIGMNDNCPGVVKTFSTTGVTVLSGSGNANGLPYNKGVTTITYLATDASGNTANCSFNLTVNDNEVPTVTCRNNISRSTDPGVCTWTAGSAVNLNGINDNCPGVLQSFSTSGATVLSGSGNANGLIYNQGITTITYLATDASGNSASCSFNLTVNDNEVPTLTCPNNLTRSTDPGLCTWTAGGAVNTNGINDNCPGVVKTFSTTGVTTLSGSGNANGLPYNKGVTTITYLATDASGNTATCSFILTVNDNEVPTITCPNDLTRSTDPGVCTWSADGAVNINGINDNCPGVSHSYSTTGVTTLSGSGNANGQLFNKGTTIITYLATDASSNTAACSFNLTVNDNELPTITCPVNVAVNNDANNCSAVVNFVTPIGLDNCPNQITVQTSGLTSGSAFPVMITTNSYNVTDASGNSATCSFTVTVTDNELPVAWCNNLTVDLNSLGAGSITSVQVNNNSTDNCGVASAIAFPLTFSCSNVGSNPVNLIVTDIHSNSSSCLSTVTVRDLVPPTAICRNITINLPRTGTVGVSASQINNGSNDACGILPPTLNPNIFVCTNKGPNAVTLSVTDNNGNTSTCGAIVTVTTDPIVLAVSSPTVNCNFNITCNGATNGSATVVTNGGCMPYAYLWSNNQTTATATGLGAGVHSVTVTDANLDSQTISITLTQPVILANTITAVNIVCFGGNTGSINLTATGGCQPYSYSWTGTTHNGPFASNDEDPQNLYAGTYNVIITDANGCVSTGSIILTQQPLMVVTTCPNQFVAMGYEPQQCAIIPANVTGGTPGYTYLWDNVAASTSASIIVCPGVTTTYTVTVTDMNGCQKTASHTITVVDVRCGSHVGSKMGSKRGSKADKVAMCKMGSHGPRNECVKYEDVYKKLNQGWTLGPCNGPNFNSAACGEPDYLNCECKGGISQVCFTYTGSVVATIVMATDANGNHPLQTFTNVQPGQTVCLNVNTMNQGSHGSHGSHNGSHNRLKAKTYIRINGGTALKFYTDCKKIAVGTVVGSMTLSGFKDESGALCNASAPPLCECKGKITSVRLTYVGPSGVTVRAYKANNHTQLINTWTNIATGAQLNISASPNLPDKIYLEIAGNALDTRINTKCGQLVIGDRVYYFDVTAWSDNNSHNCNGTPTPLKKEFVTGHSGGIGGETHLTAYPNPFNEQTTVEFSVSETQAVVLKVFNLAGKEITTLFEGEAEAGASYKLNFKPDVIAAGVYISKLVTSNGEVKFEKLILQK